MKKKKLKVNITEIFIREMFPKNKPLKPKTMIIQINKNTNVQSLNVTTFIDQGKNIVIIYNTDLFKMLKAFAKATLRYKLRQLSEFLTDLSKGCPQETKY